MSVDGKYALGAVGTGSAALLAGSATIGVANDALGLRDPVVRKHYLPPVAPNTWAKMQASCTKQAAALGVATTVLAAATAGLIVLESKFN